MQREKKELTTPDACAIQSIDAGTLSRVVYTYESVVMYVRDYTDWVVVFLFTMFLKY